jgi:hypothetical protein
MKNKHQIIYVKKVHKDQKFQIRLQIIKFL